MRTFSCLAKTVAAIIVFLVPTATIPDNAVPASPPAAALRAGAAAVDIPPEKLPVIVNGGFQENTADRVHDRLHARCLVLDDGSSRVAIVVVDNCLMPRDLLDEAKRLAHEKTGIRTDRILISATHTHSAPSVMGALGSDADPDYPRFLIGRIAEGIAFAAKNLEPARAGWAVAQALEHTNCRRWILRPDRIRTDPFGERTVRAMMHPGYQNPDFLGPAGPIDPDISMLSIQSARGRPIALLANYSMHYFGAAALSADYYGRFARKFTELIGAGELAPPFVAVMSQGTSGDLHWMDYSQPPKSIDIDTYAQQLAQIAREAYQKIEYHERLPLAMSERKLMLRMRLPDEKRLAWAKDVVKGLEGRKPASLPEIYAREQLFLVEKPSRELKLQVLRVGDLGIAAIPCEVFGITGLKIKSQGPLAPTFVMELANGADGYIPPPEQHKLGGYTTWPARSAGLEVEAEPKIVETLLEMLEEVSGQVRHEAVECDSAYTRAVLASKPIAYWRLGEFVGPYGQDATGNQNRGEYEDGVAFYLEGPALSGPSAAKQVNRAPQFAGGRMRATVKDLGPVYSLEMWFCNAMPVDARPVTGYLFSRGADGAEGAPGDHLAIGGTHSATGRLVFFNGNERNQSLAGKTEIQPKTWNHIVLARDGENVIVYLNGSTTPEISGEAEITYAPGTKQVFISGRNDNFSNFEGRIDEAALYDRPLSREEIAEHYRSAGLQASPRSERQETRVNSFAGGRNAAVSAAVPRASRPRKRGQDAPETAGKMPAVHAAMRAAPDDGTTGTFSIVAADPQSGECGAAVASKYPAVGKIVPYVRSNVGAFCTQHWHNPEWGERALDLLEAGKAPEEVLSELLRTDPQREQRQLAIIDINGRVANHNPSQAEGKSFYWAAMSGRYYSCQGNTLVGREVIVAMSKAYEETKGSIADRLMAALVAGDVAGGDHRGRLAAGILVAKRSVEGPWLELQVDQSDNAVADLARKYAELEHEAKGKE